MAEQPIGLAEAIQRVRADLAEARAQGEGEDLRFRLGEVELQFGVELAREAGGETGINVWVVSVGAKGTVTSTRTHTVSVSLLPQERVDGQWRDVMVGDEVHARPPASGSAPAGSGPR